MPSRTPPVAPAAIPELLGNRYRIERLLGVGGMGAVYQVRDLLREQFNDPRPSVALKALNDQFAAHADANALLYAEYALTCRLHHPNVIRPYSYHIDPASGRAFMTLELLEGPALDQIIADHPDGMAWPALQPLAVGLLSALAHAHDAGVLHGDLKPGNIILSTAVLRLFDFGLGRGCRGPLQRDRVLTGLQVTVENRSRCISRLLRVRSGRVREPDRYIGQRITVPCHRDRQVAPLHPRIDLRFLVTRLSFHIRRSACDRSHHTGAAHRDCALITR